MSDMDDIVREFLVESSEGLDTLDRNLVALERTPGDRELLGGIFRCIHTIKGTSGFLGFGRLEAVTHVGENLLSDLRDGRKTLTPEITSALLSLVDAVRSMLAAIERTGADGDQDFGSLVELLTRLQQEGGAPLQAEGASTPAAVPDGDSTGGRRRRKSRARGQARGTPAETMTGVSPSAAPIAASTAEPPVAPDAGEVRGPAASDSSIRVEVGLLDRLMNLVGELVLARNQILQHTASAENSGLVATTQRLNLITTELQEGVMKTRMQPIGNVWARFPRVVRDLALACGKQVRIEMEGRETELDKTIIEAIKDPLTHIVRNSVDHGLEPPAERVARGKPAEGRLLLRAYHEGGQVNIEICDDGRGIDLERVRAKARERGVITAEQAARLGEREVMSLVFAPGFSTAEKVSNISGRGVGMDVVRTNIEKIGGTVDIDSVTGQGTTLRIKIPLTLAIIPALMVTTDGDRFAIPQVSLLELVRLDGDQVGSGIEMVCGAPVYRLRGRLLPLVYLSRALGLEGTPPAPGGDPAGAGVNIVVLQADDHSFGLVVDEINDTEEIVVKPLGKQLKGLEVYAGATILGDGRVALILDVLGLGKQAQVVTKNGQQAQAVRAEAARAEASERQMLLLFQAGEDRRMAIPLSTVARLEEFPHSAIERSGGHRVVQYRGRLLPLLRLGDLLDAGGAPEARDPMPVVVYQHEGQEVGLAVDSIVDIIEDQLTVHWREQPGVYGGSAVIQGKVTDLLDVPALLRQAKSCRFAAADTELVAQGG